MNPEFFGDVPRDVRGQPGFGSFGDANVRLPGVPEGEYEGSYSRDVFAKTEKWLSPAPFFLDNAALVVTTVAVMELC